MEKKPPLSQFSEKRRLFCALGRNLEELALILLVLFVLLLVLVLILTLLLVLVLILILLLVLGILILLVLLGHVDNLHTPNSVCPSEENCRFRSLVGGGTRLSVFSAVLLSAWRPSNIQAFQKDCTARRQHVQRRPLQRGKPAPNAAFTPKISLQNLSPAETQPPKNAKAPAAAVVRHLPE